MIRKGIGFIALLYLATALICFVPYFQFGHPILIAAGFIYAVPSFIVAGGVVLKKEWGRKLAIILSPLLILAVLPLLFKKQLTFVFSFPFSIAVTYSPPSARSFKGLFVSLIVGHFISIIYLLRGSVKSAFEGKRAEGEPKEGSAEIELNAGKEETED